MPADGTVFRNDPLYHAREIWDERCAGCHGLVGTGGDKGPDLKDYNSRAWIRGFLPNPDGPLYMGPAKIDKGMKPVDGAPEELAALTEYVYAETGASRRRSCPARARARSAAPSGLRHLPRLRRRRARTTGRTSRGAAR